MFLRRCERRKSGKTHSYWALVESYRTAKGSRQRVVAYLGDLKPSQKPGWAALGKRLQRGERPQPSLFDPPPCEEVDEDVLVQLRGVRLENLRDFGDVWLAWGLWRLLGLDTLLADLLPAGREDVPWGTIAAILTIARFCAPGSEFAIEHTWYRRTSLPELIDVPVAQVHTDRLYAGLDRLLTHKDAIERHLHQRLRHLFDFDYDLLLYDVTSTYFEGDVAANPQAQRGYSRDSMPVLALIYPSFVLAEVADPLVLPAAAITLPTAAEIIRLARDQLAPKLDAIVQAWAGTGPPDAAWYWAAPILLDFAADPVRTREWFADPERATKWSGVAGTAHRESRHWPAHINEAIRVLDRLRPLGPPPDDLADVVARMAIGAPGVCSLRALGRGMGSPVEAGIRDAAGTAAWPFVSLFNAPEVIALLGGRKRKQSYWKKALRYGVNGGLQAVLDEYVHLAREALAREEDPTAAVAARLREVLHLRTVSLGVGNVEARPRSGEVTIKPQRMRVRFAMRFGNEKDDEGGETRAEQVRDAFNSPFWPFVLVTTSVGQEGLDFHSYCHAVVHWNLPANPVDLEQREGRVNRYKNHAVRKNLAQTYGHVALAPDVGDPWEEMFEVARRGRQPGQSDLVPYWVFAVEGGAAVERHAPAVPLSRDVDRLEDLRRSLAVYRLVFGQSRQEDLLAFLAANCVPEELQAMAHELQMDLRPADTTTVGRTN